MVPLDFTSAEAVRQLEGNSGERGGMRGEAGSIRKRIPYLQKCDKAVITSIFVSPVLVPELAACSVYLYGCMRDEIQHRVLENFNILQNFTNKINLPDGCVAERTTEEEQPRQSGRPDPCQRLVGHEWVCDGWQRG